MSKERLNTTEDICTRLEAYGIKLIQGRYEQNPIADNNHAYHDSFHASIVTARALFIALALEASFQGSMSKRQQKILALKCKYHDSIKTWYIVESEQDGYSVQTRKARTTIFPNGTIDCEDEWNSATELMTLMEQCDEFTQEEIDSIWPSIKATIPYYHPEKGTVTQPFFTNESAEDTKILAVSDVNSSLFPKIFVPYYGSISGIEAKLAEGDALFREYNMDISRHLRSGITFTPAHQKQIRDRILVWNEREEIFSRNRLKCLIEEELERFGTKKRDVLLNLFTAEKSPGGGRILYAERALEAIRVRTNQRAQMTNFWELIGSVGYDSGLRRLAT